MDRIWKICTFETDRKSEVETLKTILTRNDYPPEIVNQEIARYLQNKATPQQSDKPTKERAPEKRFIVLPFVHRKADDFAVRLKNLVCNNFPQVDFNAAFTAPCTISDLFPFKDQIKKVEEMSKVVYKLRCETCGAEYIGKTRFILAKRIYQHKISEESAIRQHLQRNNSHIFDFSKVQVIDRTESDYMLKLLELQHIIKEKPLLNKQLNSQSNYEIKTLIIAAYANIGSKASEAAPTYTNRASQH